MSQFNILDPSLALDRKYFIEASAGCGKTFSIENAYVRLIMESKHNLSVENILVLTFTKEATSELRARIRASLENARNQLIHEDPESFEYIKKSRDLPEADFKKVVRNLQDALANFDSSQIFTIHKFCYLQLKQFLFEAKLDLSQDIEKKQVTVKTYEEIVKDYLSFSYDSNIISPAQLKLLLTFHKNDFSILLKACVGLLSKEAMIEKTQPFSSFYKLCAEEIEELKLQHGLNSSVVYETCLGLTSFYKGAMNREKKVNKQLNDAFEDFSNLFSDNCTLSKVESSLLSFSFIYKTFQDANLKKSALKQNKDEAIWKNLSLLKKQLFPLFQQASVKENLITLVAYECQKLVQSFFNKNKILTPNNILEKLLNLIQDEDICSTIASQYQAVIIDEFQDTDPVQWGILSKIFLQNEVKERPFYLVGDPKQSIYAFRKADIYTYLKAAQMMGISEPQTLNVNYRSQPQLISALNNLFGKQNGNWINLPKLKTYLPYKPVLSSSSIEEVNFHDDRKSMHFILAEQKERVCLSPSLKVEQEILFPFIANEINRLHHQEKLKLSSFAVLIRDRFQGARLKNFLKKSRIAFTSTRPESLQGLDSVAQFLQIYLATLHFQKSKNIHNLKINSLLNWPLELFETKNLVSLTEYFSSLRTLLLERGFLAFYEKLTSEQSFLEKSLYQRLLSIDEGIYLYQELEQIKELLLQKEIEGCDAYQLLGFLDDLSKLEALPEKTYPLRQNFEEEGVQLLTLHMSKGLEFDVVFALGLVNQVKIKEDLILHKTNKLLPVTALPEQDYIEHLQELDAEKLRTLYVALTRAKQRLYVPCIFSSKEPSLGQSSSMDLFLQSQNFDLESLKAFISHQNEMSFTYCEGKIDVQSFASENHQNLIAPTELSLNFAKRFKHSFTSLSNSSSYATSEVKAPHDFEAIEKNIHTMPAGAHTGSFIHKIMEGISFDIPINLEHFISKTRFELWKDVIDELIEKLIQTPIQIKGKTFTLSELKKSQIYKEIEFLYPVKENLQIEEIKLKGSFLHGFMDLVFMHEGMYYLIDYKTNWLGEGNTSYSDLELAMGEHNYRLQAQIYQEALKNYINVFESRPFEECFGGIIYWFVRGIDHTNRGLLVL